MDELVRFIGTLSVRETGALALSIVALIAMLPALLSALINGAVGCFDGALDTLRHRGKAAAHPHVKETPRKSLYADAIYFDEDWMDREKFFSEQWN